MMRMINPQPRSIQCKLMPNCHISGQLVRGIFPGGAEGQIRARDCIRDVCTDCFRTVGSYQLPKRYKLLQDNQ